MKMNMRIKNKKLIDSQKYLQQIISNLEKVSENKEKIKYLCMECQIVYEEIENISLLDFKDKIVLSPEYVKLDILKEAIINRIKLLNAQTQTPIDTGGIENVTPKNRKIHIKVLKLIKSIKNQLSTIEENNEKLIFLSNIYTSVCEIINKRKKAGNIDDDNEKAYLKDLETLSHDILNNFDLIYTSTPYDDKEQLNNYLKTISSDNKKVLIGKLQKSGRLIIVDNKLTKFYEKLTPNQFGKACDENFIKDIKKSKETIEPENKLIIWKKSEESLKEFLTELIKKKYIEKDSFENLYKHFYIEGNSKFNSNFNILPEKKIICLFNRRNLIFMLQVLIKSKIISSAYSNVNLILHHFSLDKIINLKENSIRTASYKVKKFNEDYINENDSDTRFRFKIINETIKNILNPSR